MAKNIKKALVTGGAGFIGSHIVDALIKRRIKVVIVDDLSTGENKNVNPNARFFKMSITSPNFPKLLKNVKPDVVFHCAAQINVRESVKDPLKDARVNILGTLAVAQAAKDAKVKKIIFSSTGGAIYSERDKPPYSERDRSEPVSPYGIAKRTSEQYLEFMHGETEIPYVSLRYANVYGPRQNAKGEAGVIAVFTERMLEGKPVVINGTGTKTRDFVYVDDVVRANMKAMQKNVVGEFNIGTGKQVSINQVFRKLNALTGGLTKERHGPDKAGEARRSALRFTKAKRHLDWSPKVSIDDGLEKTVKWFKKKH